MKTYFFKITAILFILTSFCVYNIFSQTVIDSLKQKVEDASKNEKARYLNDLANECFFAGMLEECVNYSNDALNQADKTKNNVEKARALINLARVYSMINDIPQSNQFAFRAVQIASVGKDKANLAEAYHILGLNNDQTDYNKALEYHNKALDIRRQIKDKKGISKSLNSIGQIYENKGESKKAIEFFNQSLIIKNELGDMRGVGITHYNLAKSFYNLDKYDSAMTHLQKALEVLEPLKIVEYLAKCNNIYGIIFQKMKNNDKALEYYKKALKFSEEIDDKIGICDALTNIGITYSLKENHLKAIEFLEKALKLRLEIEYKSGIANCYQNLGLSYSRINNDIKALDYYKKAVEINEELGNKKELAANFTAIGTIYKNMKQYNSAVEYFNRSIQLSIEIGSMDIRQNAYLNLSLLYKESREFEKALTYYEKYTELKDSILNKDMFNQISELQTKYETEKNKQEIILLNKDKELQANKLARQRSVIVFFIIGLVLVLGLVVVILQSLQRKKRDNAIIAKEKARVEELLLNILPLHIVNELKEQGTTHPEGFDNVSVFFSDIVGFTKASAILEPNELISELNDMFTAFDDIFTRHHCERIKTIGDAYMAVCGMPVENENHAINIANAAIDVIDYLNKRNETHKHQWKIRIGINSGKAVGGIVGVRKYLYDVFGDTVNTASRMESNSEVMRINCSENTYAILKDTYKFTERQALEVKGKGLMKMYFLEI